MKTLLQGVVRDLPDGAVATPPVADVAALIDHTAHALRADLERMGVQPASAVDGIVRAVLAALQPTLTADVSLEDKTASCILAERVLNATLIALVQSAQGAPPDPA